MYYIIGYWVANSTCSTDFVRLLQQDLVLPVYTLLMSALVWLMWLKIFSEKYLAKQFAVSFVAMGIPPRGKFIGIWSQFKFCAILTALHKFPLRSPPRATPFEIRSSESLKLKCFQISNGQISDSNCIFAFPPQLSLLGVLKPTGLQGQMVTT